MKPADKSLCWIGYTVVFSDTDPIPYGWRNTLEPIDCHWVSQALFQYSMNTGKTELNDSKLTQMWFSPPQPFLSTNHVPKVDRYFTRRLCLWMPKKMWKARLVQEELLTLSEPHSSKVHGSKSSIAAYLYRMAIFYYFISKFISVIHRLENKHRLK